MPAHRIPLDDDSSRAWTEIAHGTRLHWRILVNVGEPGTASNFTRVHELYPYERVADRCRAFVGAALEHLMLWADIVAPFKFHPEQAAVFQQRPPYTLARAALEASAQAVWMLDTPDPLECIRRHLCLMRWDLQEHREARSIPPRKWRSSNVRRRFSSESRMSFPSTKFVRPTATSQFSACV